MSAAEDLARSVEESETPLRIMGGGTKVGIGRQRPEGIKILSTLKLDEILYFEPTEFVLSAQAGCLLKDLNAVLDKHDLSLPFNHPWAAAGATLGGAVATNLGGTERLDLGAPRDNVLGVQYVNGKGALLRAGGRVMKNVTGLDIGRALASSWGRLAVITEITVKLVPKTKMPTNPFDPLRLEEKNVWRLSVPGRHAADLREQLGGNVRHQDWNGGLAWIASDDNALDVHAIASHWGGHALRIRGEGQAFQPRNKGVQSLEDRVKMAFDPEGIFDSQFDG